MPGIFWTFISLGCIDGFGQGPVMPEENEYWLSVSSKPIEADAVEVRLLEDFLVPQLGFAEEISDSRMRQCLAGEDVRAHIPSTYSVMEVTSEYIQVGDVQAVWLESDGVSTYDQSNGRIISLYEELLTLRSQARMLSGACFPATDGRLLVVFPAEAPAPLVWQALGTAWEAGFEEIYLLVSDPVAERKAQTTPPRPPFKPDAQRIPERAQALDLERLAQARAQLAAGRLVGEQVRFCQDSVRLTFGAPSAGVSVQRLDSSGKREDQGAVLKTGLGAALGKTYETVWVAPQKESRTADFVEVLSALYDQGQVPAMQPLIAEEVDFLTLSAGSPVVHTPYWSAKADYDSYLSNQWVSLIPLKFGKRHDGSCVDP